MTDADTCRSRGWFVGDVIVGTSSTGRTDAWRITAIGDELVCRRTVAALVSGVWRASDEGESLGDLSFREWERATPEQWTLIHRALASRAREQALQAELDRLTRERDEARADVGGALAVLADAFGYYCRANPDPDHYPEPWAEVAQDLLGSRHRDESKHPQFTKFRRTNVAEMRPYIPGEFLHPSVSISEPDREAGSPKLGDMIARNPENHADQWLVAETYFRTNFAPMADGSVAVTAPSKAGTMMTQEQVDALAQEDGEG